MTEIELHLLAEEEMNVAALFYEARVPGLGGEFLDEIARCLDRISAHPKSGQVCFRRFRRLPLARFPYVVVYEFVANGILVIAVANQRRRPGYWRRRI